jgi:hypothetical protein
MQGFFFDKWRYKGSTRVVQIVNQKEDKNWSVEIPEELWREEEFPATVPVITHKDRMINTVYLKVWNMPS